MKKHVPNTLTCCNLICGCIATHFALQAQLDMALFFIIAGAVFDFFDGFAARLLHVSSPLGKELDSLADDITFGFAPAAIVFTLLRALFPTTAYTAGTCPVAGLIPYAAFLIAAFSALRLAKFNLDERQSTSFIGLPTPANALFWGALIVGTSTWWTAQPLAWAILLTLCLFSSWILVSEVPMFALKFKTYGLADNKLRYGFILLSAALLVWLGWTGFSAIIICYVLLSILSNLRR